MNRYLFRIQRELSGLNDVENWFGDSRDRLVTFLGVLVEGTEYSFKKNTTDSSAKILELWKKGETNRRMGLVLHPRKQEIGAFFNLEFYNSLREYLVLPDNQRKDKTQPHMVVSLEQIWLVIRVATEVLE